LRRSPLAVLIMLPVIAWAPALVAAFRVNDAVVVAGTRFLRIVMPAVPASADAEGSGDTEPRVPGPHSVVLHEEAVIKAEPSRIWQILVDLPRYSEWNPWLTRAEGRAEPGAEVDVDVVLGNRTMKAKHVVLAVEPEKRFCWRDAGWNSWFVYGQRCRTLDRQADGTVLFRQELLLDGPLAGLAKLTQGKDLQAGMAAETAALKARAEQDS